MKLAVSLGGYYTSAANYLEAARMAEKNGLHSLWIPDSPMIHRDAYMCLAMCAEETSKLLLGTAVANPVSREASTLANSMSTLNEVSNGRAILGIGPGDSAVRRIGKSPATVAQMESSIQMIRQICSGEPVRFPNGEEIAMRWSKGKIPVFISATGTKMLELTGRIADGSIINVGASREAVTDAVKHLQIGMSARGQKSDFTVADLTFINISENRHDAINAAKPYVVWYLKNAPRLLEINNISPNALDSKVEQVSQEYVKHDHIHTDNWSTAMERSTFISDDLVEKFVVAGNPEDCVRKLKEKERAGVELFIARHTGDENDWKSFFRMYCENVLPEFRK